MSLAEALLNSAAFLVAAARQNQWPLDEGREIAFAGRSNVGKSSAINAITRRQGLARTSKTPGRTQQIVFFDLGQNRRLVDLPGYGYAKVPERVKAEWGRLIEAYLASRRSLLGVVALMDARRPLTDLDRQLLLWCRSAGLPVHVLLTKSDKVSKNELKRSEFRVIAHFKELGLQATVAPFSSLSRDGVPQAQDRLLEWLQAPNPGCGN